MLNSHGIGVFISILIFVLPRISIADNPGIIIEHADGTVIDNMYSVNATISYQLGKEIRDALDHGIPLEFEIELQIKKQRPWIWDKTIVSRIIAYRVEHQPLSGQYLLTNLNNGNLDQLQNLTDVFKSIGEIRNFPLAENKLLSGNEQFYVQIKTHLNIRSLPAPLRPLAYLSSQWHLASPWQTWTVTQ